MNHDPLNHRTSHTVALITHTAPWKHATELHLVANPCLRRWTAGTTHWENRLQSFSSL